MRPHIGFAAILSLFAFTAAQAQEEMQAVIDTCGETTNLPDEICTCVGELAAEELSLPGQAYLAALMAGDEAAASALQADVPVADQIAAPLFMVSGPQRCAS